jgi:hypothetical protein
LIFSSPLPDVEIPDLPLTAYVLDGAAGQPDKPALIDGVSGQTLTYADLGRAVGSLAGGLAASGFARGEVLALMAPNMPGYAVVFHAVASGGGLAGGGGNAGRRGLRVRRGPGCQAAGEPVRRAACRAGAGRVAGRAAASTRPGQHPCSRRVLS